ncbi:MAG: LuxR C-terminal-related transcriptional regulator [Desulfobacterales bacterium]
MTRLAEAARALFAGLNPDPDCNLRLIVQYTAKFLGCECAALGWAEDPSARPRFRAAFRLDPPPSPAREAAREICRAILGQSGSCAESGACPPNPRFRSFLAHPVLLDGRARGALIALDGRERSHGEEERSLIGFLANLAAAEESRRLAAAAVARLAAVEAVLEAVSSARRQAASREEFLDRFLASLAAALGVEGVFFIPESSGGSLPSVCRFYPPLTGKRGMKIDLAAAFGALPTPTQAAPPGALFVEADPALPRPPFARRGVNAWVLSPVSRDGISLGLLGLELKGGKNGPEPAFLKSAAVSARLLEMGLEELALREGVTSLEQTVQEISTLIDPEHKEEGSGDTPAAGEETPLRGLERSLRELAERIRGKRRFAYRNLSPTEIRVANWIREGRSSKEIAKRLGLSPRTIHTHRYNIRKKLNLSGAGKNLRAHLAAME